MNDLGLHGTTLLALDGPASNLHRIDLQTSTALADWPVPAIGAVTEPVSGFAVKGDTAIINRMSGMGRMSLTVSGPLEPIAVPNNLQSSNYELYDIPNTTRVMAWQRNTSNSFIAVFDVAGASATALWNVEGRVPRVSPLGDRVLISSPIGKVVEYSLQTFAPTGRTYALDAGAWPPSAIAYSSTGTVAVSVANPHDLEPSVQLFDRDASIARSSSWRLGTHYVWDEALQFAAGGNLLFGVGGYWTDNRLVIFEDHPPDPQSAEPAILRPGESTTVHITGDNLAMVTSASFGADVNVHTVHTVSASEVDVDVTLPSTASSGPRDIVLSTAAGVSGTGRELVAVQTTAGEYVPIAPARLLDTRFGTGGRKGALHPNETMKLQVAGVGGVPAASQVDSVLLNVTVTQATGYGFLSVYPAGGAPPNASNLNFVPGQTIPNMVSAKLSADGKVSIYSSAGTHVLADVVGYYSSATGPAGARLLPLPPIRLYDSRDDSPYTSAVPVDYACGFPPLPGGEGLVLNVTAVNANQNGWVTVWTAGQPMPPTSNLNVANAAAVPNMVVVTPDAGGCISVNTSINSVDLIFDISGVFIDSDQFPGPAFTGQSPTRVLDTRTGVGAPAHPVAAYQPITLSLAGQIPVGTAAVLLNVTVTQPTQPGYVTVWPTDEPMPLASSLNFVPGQTVPNLVLAPVSADGKVKLMAAGGTHLIADLAGYFN